MKCLKLIPFVFIFSVIVVAQDRVSTPTTPSSEPGGTELSQQLFVGFDFSYFGFKQPGASFTKKKGLMFGVYGDYGIYRDKFLFRLDGNASFGDLDYGSANSGALNGIRHLLFDARLRVGRPFGNKNTVTPFAGLGYRYLSEETGMEVTSLDVFGPDRRSNYLYTPLGLECMLRLGKKWSVSPSGEYDLFWRGWQFNRANDIDKTLPNIKNVQHDGYGARGSIRLVRNFGHLDFFIEPYIKYWNIENSETSVIQLNSVPVNVIEPAHNSKEWGARLGIGLF